MESKLIPDRILNELEHILFAIRYVKDNVSDIERLIALIICLSRISWSIFLSVSTPLT